MIIFETFCCRYPYPIPDTSVPLRTGLFVTFPDHHFAGVVTLGVREFVLSVVHTLPNPLLKAPATRLGALQQKKNMKSLAPFYYDFISYLQS